MNWKGFTSAVVCSQFEGLPADVPARSFRAIYHPDSDQPLEFLGDRMADRGDVQPLLRWLKLHALRIQKQWRREGPPSSSTHWVKYDADGGHFHGTPNASYGYVYCVAWLDPQPEGKA